MSAIMPNLESTTENNNISVPSQPDAIIKSESMDNNKQLNNNLEACIDAPELAVLLQCLGFTLQNFEKKTDTVPHPSPLIDVDHLQIDITCIKSNMKATFFKEKSGCKCPSKEDTSNAQFWNISACSPSLPGNVTVSKSSLIPTISVEKSAIISIILTKALDIINSTDAAGNLDNFGDLFKNSAVIARHRSLENIKQESFSASASKALPKVQCSEHYSPTHRKTSSPIPDLSNSLKQDCEKASKKLIDTLIAAQKLLGDAVEMAGNQNATFTKRTRRLSDIKISPLAAEEVKSSNASSLNVSKLDGSHCKTPKKSKTPKKGFGIGDKRKYLAPPMKLNRVSDSALPKVKLLQGKKNTPSPSQKSLNLCAKVSTNKCNSSLTKLRAPTKIASFSRTPVKK